MSYGRLSVVEDADTILAILDKTKKRETVRDKANATRKEILALISEKKSLTMKEIQVHINRGPKAIRYNINVLRRAGLLRRINNLREMRRPLYALGKEE